MQVFLQGLGALLATQLVTGVASQVALLLTRGAPRARVALSLLVAVAYQVAVFYTVTRPQVLMLGVAFVYYHFGFTCRLLSSIWFFRDDRAPAKPFFHLFMLIATMRQNYGGGDWSETGGKRFGGRFFVDWLRHMGYSVVVAAVAIGVFLWIRANPGIPYRLPLLRAVGFIVGLEMLTAWANVSTLLLSFVGQHFRFFGNFAWFRSNHIGEFWRNWNTVAIVGFAELTSAFRLRRRFLLNTLVIFAVSGVLHQVLVWYFTRSPSYLTLLSFMIHALAVYAFGRLYHLRRSMPAAVRVLLFNQVVTLIVALTISQPFIADMMSAFTRG
jgi:hypothetical protein